MHIAIGSKIVSEEREYDINLCSGNPSRLALTEFTINEQTYVGAEFAAHSFRKGDEIRLRFQTFDAVGNVANPLNDAWHVEVKKESLLKPPDGRTYKSRLEKSGATNFLDFVIDVEDGNIPLRGDKIPQAVGFVGVGQKPLDLVLEFRVIRSRIPSSLEVRTR